MIRAARKAMAKSVRFLSIFFRSFSARRCQEPKIELVPKTGKPTPLPCFLEVLILNDFKSFEPEVLILRDFKSLFPEVLILVGLKGLRMSGLQKIANFLEVLNPGELSRMK